MQLAAAECWQVAFLDLGLPGMNGYELASALQAMPAHATLPLFALSGYGRKDDRLKTTEAGFSGHLVKPASVDDVERAIQGLAAGSSVV
ncbi:MAG: response regulator [Rhizobacter sp.]|nr:response regulator [Rhizobacter sp.]